MRSGEKLAKGIRIITIPPVMITLFVAILYSHCDFVFSSAFDVGATLFFLGIMPVLAYPLQKCIPNYKEKGREGQRELAFLFTIFGYIGAWGYGWLFRVSHALQLLFNAYLLSVLLMFSVNKLLKIRASGHACSAAAPMVLAGYFLNIGWALSFLLLFIASVWASVTLKRHKFSDMMFGVAVFLCAFSIALLF